MTPAGVRRKLREEGARGLAQRVARQAYRRLGAATLDDPLLPGDVADSTRVRLQPGTGRDDDGPLHVGWVTTPPAAGSGGHTTMFRMVAALERAGHRCTILLYDRHHGLAAESEQTIRRGWPEVAAAVRSVDEGFEDLDAAVATGWETAHVLARRATAPLHRFYFVQDYEPWFYPHGSEHELAADSYRLGFTTIALGNMVQHRLHTEVGVESVLAPFSCDTAVYSLQHRGPRSGVVFYAKPGVGRRGYQHGVAALAELHARHPEQTIHLFGTRVRDLDFPAEQHGRLSPRACNTLYNRCAAGLAMSFTNISLVAEEMLASGCLPVVNDSRDSRADLTHPDVIWAGPTPGSLADGLCRAVELAADGAAASRASTGVRQDRWANAGHVVTTVIENEVRGAAAANTTQMEEAR